MVRRTLLVLAAVALMVATIAVFGGLALADAQRNAHNCYGVAASRLVPPSNQGEHARNEAHKRTQDDFQKEASEDLANCGDTPA
jgi:hypothetical protein